MKRLTSILACLLPSLVSLAAETNGPVNLLCNPGFAFHSFDGSRTGAAASFRSGAVPGWNQNAYKDAEVFRAPKIGAFRPRFMVDNAVVIHPGKRFGQFITLAELRLDHGDRISLSVFGFQSAPGALQASIHLMRLDSASGEWSPSNFGQADKRSFPKHSRGELVKAPGQSVKSGSTAGDFELKVENVEITGAFAENAKQSTDQPNTIGIQVEFSNLSPDKDVWIYSPCLCRGNLALNRLPEGRPLPVFYRGLPRTIQKLWRGEPLHIIVMGSSIDRGSANPPQYLYDEDISSKTWKQPIGNLEFDGTKVGHPEWSPHIAQWRHYFSSTGRLRRLLMEKFDYPIQKILLNYMACDGSSISEAHSALAEYSSLALPPNPELNGHQAGKTWQELYPEVFSRPGGSRPDLVIFGSGANEKVDGADEIALFEGAIRWFQRHYPGVEFLFCMFQNRETYTRNTGHLMELSLRYQIPYVDYGQIAHLACRHCNSYALVPKDGHPQAAGHFLWAKQMEKAFDAADPIESGIAQLHLPERISPFTIGWEGEVISFDAPHARIRNDTGFMIEDTVVNLWAVEKDSKVEIRVDGKPHTGSGRHSFAKRNSRNSTFATGKLALGDRHVVEIGGKEARLIAVDAKVVPGRRWFGVANKAWDIGKLAPQPFASQWGAPCGGEQIVMPPGGEASINLVATDISIAWADDPQGGTLIVEIDGANAGRISSNTPFETMQGEKLFMENRKGWTGLPYGVHSVRVKAEGGPVHLLGAFSYDTRANRVNERVLRGEASPGETLTFSQPFKARPVVLCTGGLQVLPAKLTPAGISFAGSGPGSFEITGE
ncbi:MAG: hypothetical protein PHV34_09040 [Verrucomicrobiae bacterium]|nr:hypothetical protein [Verrucomicrobiae bacterium]